MPVASNKTPSTRQLIHTGKIAPRELRHHHHSTQSTTNCTHPTTQLLPCRRWPAPLAEHLSSTPSPAAERALQSVPRQGRLPCVGAPAGEPEWQPPAQPSPAQPVHQHTAAAYSSVCWCLILGCTQRSCSLCVGACGGMLTQGLHMGCTQL